MRILKPLTIAIVLIFLIPLIEAIYECQPVMKPSEATNCSITTTWNYTPPCANYVARVFNQSGINFQNFSFSDFGNTKLCVTYWNITAFGSFYYLVSNGDTGEVKISAVNGEMEIALTLFLLAINIVLFWIPFKLVFGTNPIVDFLLKRGIWILAYSLLWFNANILMTMASNAGLGVNLQLSTLYLMLSIGMLAAIIYLLYTAVTMPFKMIQEIAKSKAGGELPPLDDKEKRYG